MKKSRKSMAVALAYFLAPERRDGAVQQVVRGLCRLDALMERLCELLRLCARGFGQVLESRLGAGEVVVGERGLDLLDLAVERFRDERGR